MQELLKSLVKARLKFKRITKNKEGYGYKYADLGELFDATNEALSSEGLLVIQVPICPTPQLMGIRTEIWHESGEHLTYEFVPDLNLQNVGTQKGVQALGSLISYLKRYHYAAIFGLAAEDDDGAAAVEEFKVSHKQAPKAPVTKPNIAASPIETKESLLEFVRHCFANTTREKRNQISNSLNFEWPDVGSMSIQELREIKDQLNAK